MKLSEFRSILFNIYLVELYCKTIKLILYITLILLDQTQSVILSKVTQELIPNSGILTKKFYISPTFQNNQNRPQNSCRKFELQAEKIETSERR